MCGQKGEYNPGKISHFLGDYDTHFLFYFVYEVTLSCLIWIECTRSRLQFFLNITTSWRLNFLDSSFFVCYIQLNDKFIHKYFLINKLYLGVYWSGK